MQQREGFYELHIGDCIDKLKLLDDESQDSCVTDGPYGYRFMDMAWDGADIEKNVAARRAAKSQNPNAGPNGGHNSAAIEAGRYDMTPESMRAFQEFSEAWAREVYRVLKPGGHLLSFCATRTYHRMVCGIEDAGFEIRDGIAWVYGTGMNKVGYIREEDGSHVVEGHAGTMKPAHEPICVARKPFKGTLRDNLRLHGTGAFNIDACLVKNPGEVDRWTANLLHDGSECVVAMFPQSAGAGGSLPQTKITGYGSGIGNGKSEYLGGERTKVESGTGSAARFFNSFQLDDEDIAASKLIYCPKATNKDRHEGLEDPGQQFEHGTLLSDARDLDGRGNHHPTVKPTGLILHCIRLVTPPGGKTVDPFAGSGSMGKAAIIGGFYATLIERDDDGKGKKLGYEKLIVGRCNYAITMREAANDPKAAPMDSANDEQGDLFAELQA